MKTETKQQYSCVDCGVTNCNKMDKQYPEFCLTTAMDGEFLGDEAYGQQRGTSGSL